MQRNVFKLVVRAHELRFDMFNQHWVQSVKNIDRSHLRACHYLQYLMCVLIQGCQHFGTAPIAEFILNKVDGPGYMVEVCGPQPHDIAVLMIKPPLLLMQVVLLQAFFISKKALPSYG